MNEKPSYEFVDSLRKMAGTLPSECPNKQTHVYDWRESADIEIVDHNANPYKAMFLTSTATWGNNEFENKWPIISPEGKFEIVKAVLTNNTLPQAREVINFVFRVKGIPRWLFDYHTQVKFMTIMSIGCRDNNKLDADVLTFNDPSLADAEIFGMLKDLYELALTGDQASWQSARTFMPQSYSHSYYFSQNVLAISNALSSFKEFHEESNSDESKIKFQALTALYQHFIVPEVYKHFPLIGDYLQNSIRSKEQRDKFFEKLSKMKYSQLTDSDKEYFEKE